MSYSIWRFYYPNDHRKARKIKSGLSLEQAQKHCQDPKTRKEGVWFDGYQEDKKKIRKTLRNR